MTSKKEGILDSLRYYDELRASASSVVRPIDSNLDILLDGDQEIAVCHLPVIVPFTQGNNNLFKATYEDAAAVALAAQHLNAGDGSLVPDVQGLNERCKIRFTTEFRDTEYSPGTALQHVVDITGRELPEQKPCAFLGAYRSAVSIPTSIVTSVLGYPQVSASSTSSDLDDKQQYTLFGRTVPSDAGNAVPLIMYLYDVLKVKHLAAINVNGMPNTTAWSIHSLEEDALDVTHPPTLFFRMPSTDAYGNKYVDGMRNAAAIYAPDMTIVQIPLDDSESSIKAAIDVVKASGFRYVFAAIFTHF